MQRFWDGFLLPVAQAAQAKVLCEIGTLEGGLTRKVLAYCAGAAAVAHVIDPLPRFDVEGWRKEFGETFVFHRALSLEVLDAIPLPDLVLIDGDHNWYTVINELRTLDRRAREEHEVPPVVALHDVAWPYARRDLYYNPDRIPDVWRQPFARLGMRPESRELVEPERGINGEGAKALIEGGPHNGVLTAIEDFVEESPTSWTLHTLPGFNGLGLLVPAARTDSDSALERAVAMWNDPHRLRSHIEAVERARLEMQLARIGVTARERRAREEATRLAVERDVALDKSRSIQKELDRLQAERDEAHAAAQRIEQTHARDLTELRKDLWRITQERDEARATAEQWAQAYEADLKKARTDLKKAIRVHKSHLSQSKKEVSRIASSRVWRYGWATRQSLRTLTFRRDRGRSPLDLMRERLDRGGADLPPVPTTNTLRLREPDQRTAVRQSVNLAEDTVVYTAIAGDYDELKVPAIPVASGRFVCFTDLWPEAPAKQVWEQRPFDYLHADPVRTARYVKLHPHLYFPDYEWSIWIDANLLVRGDLRELVDVVRKRGVMGSYPHPHRQDVYEEAEEILRRGGLDNPAEVEAVVDRYRREGILGRALFETNVLVRRHNDQGVVALMNAWWREVENGSRRDQLSLPLAVERADVNIVPLGSQGESVRTSPLFMRYHHGATTRPA